MRSAVALAALFLLPASTAAAQASGAVTVYRCVDAKGHVTLGDAPCPAGEKEEMRTMQRPLDAAATAPVSRVVAPTAQTPPPAPEIVVLRPPQPMYECIAPDGTRYTSDTGDGNPRWVPLWTLGYRSGRSHGGRPGANLATGRLDEYHSRRPLGGWVGAPAPVPPAPSSGGGHRPPLRPPPHGYAGAPGTWVRDTCHALPPAEVCARLRDRREEIRRRFFNAQESERSELRREERGINARLEADCR
jgi:hypothetical protein